MTDGGLDGAVVLVTGAGHGIGRASARRFAAAGARLVVVDRDGEAVRRTVEALPGEAIAVQADVASEAEVDRYMAAAVERFGAVHVHHLNAGVISSLAPFPEVPVEEFDRVLGVNARGGFLGLRAAFRQFERQRGGGAVVLTSSIHALRGATDLIAYQVSKAAITGLVAAGAMHGAPIGVRVNAVAPGVIPTPDDAEVRRDMQARSRTIPMRRAGTVGEVAKAVVYLAGADASYVTGQTLSVDGGASIVNTVRPSGGAGAWEPK
ncbi:SDR family NAD(P)-dependent oxidoreductase [Microbacterium sp.]|uniref:SDR family NAD(P)-dependent oxidoreductase n=1 Tax=Microbacterium sp. TaxID=51671 RepID=UPI003A8CB325